MRAAVENVVGAAAGVVVVVALARRRPACRKLTCTVSMPPSRHCSQLHSSMTLDSARRSGAACVQGNERRRRLQLRGPHVGPDDAACLMGGVGRDAHAVLEVARGRLGWHVDALRRGIELPTVVNAAQAVFFVTSPEQVDAPVRAGGIDDANRAVGGAKGDEVFPE